MSWNYRQFQQKYQRIIDIFYTLLAGIDGTTLGRAMTNHVTLEKKMKEYHAESRLTTKETARVMGVSESYVNKTRLSGRGGPPFEKIGRSIRYRHGTLLSWMAAQTRRSTSDEGEAREFEKIVRSIPREDFGL